MENEQYALNFPLANTAFSTTTAVILERSCANDFIGKNKRIETKRMKVFFHDQFNFVVNKVTPLLVKLIPVSQVIFSPDMTFFNILPSKPISEYLFKSR